MKHLKLAGKSLIFGGFTGCILGCIAWLVWQQIAGAKIDAWYWGALFGAIIGGLTGPAVALLNNLFSEKKGATPFYATVIAAWSGVLTPALAGGDAAVSIVAIVLCASVSIVALILFSQSNKLDPQDRILLEAIRRANDRMKTKFSFEFIHVEEYFFSDMIRPFIMRVRAMCDEAGGIQHGRTVADRLGLPLESIKRMYRYSKLENSPIPATRQLAIVVKTICADSGDDSAVVIDRISQSVAPLSLNTVQALADHQV